jgi:cobalt/nickel transport system permease protein
MIRETSMYAGINKLSNINPLEKLLIMLVPLLSGAFSEKWEVVIFNIGVMSIIGILSKLSWKMAKKFIFISVLFATFSIIPLLFESKYDLAVLIILRAINGGIAISFFALTTPINHVVYLMYKTKYLSDVADIAKSFETFLIVIEKDFEITFKARKCRGEGTKYIDKLKSISKVCGVVFKNLLYRWKEISEGLKNRCYRGKYNYSYKFKINYVNLIFAFMYLLTNLMIILLNF